MMDCDSTFMRRDDSIAHPLVLVWLLSAVLVAPASANEALSRPSNALANETSPYLLLHAHNPVDWYPWGEAALKKARDEKKMIFLSIGYSSCHWCHVMERESFMDDEIANFLNEHFVCIKVDREERPDIDAIYMTAVQMMTGRGGWPMSVFLTADAKPFFGGTYFPARDNDRPGSIGFLTLLKRLVPLWQTRQAEVLADADKLTELIKGPLQGATVSDESDRPPLALEPELLQRLQSGIAAQFDAEHGGFGFSDNSPQMPKFPEPSNLWFLVSQGTRGDSDAQRMVTITLDHMAQGGIYDHVGGGFHRYSTDRFWRIPHFEKMLYDNGQLLSLYARAHRLDPTRAYDRVVHETVVAMVRDFRAAEGAFYTALDAETDGEEGRYYAWTADEIAPVLQTNVATRFASLYGLDQPPNFEGKHVLLLREPLGVVDDEIVSAHGALLAVRQRREPPLLDTKILTAWNGLMIRGLADAGQVFDRPEYIEYAARAAEFLWDHLRRDDGTLWRTHTAGKPQLNAYLDDYAFYIDGLLGLHAATNETSWLDRAIELQGHQDRLFWDTMGGGYYFTANGHEALIVRGKQFVDGARPSGNGVAAGNLVYLAQHAPAGDLYRARAEKVFRAAATYWDKSPHALPRMGAALADWVKFEQ